MYKKEIEELSKRITGIEMVWDKIKPLTEEQQLSLLNQMKRFLELKDMHVTSGITKDSNGKLVLNQGDLIHGMKQWDIEKLKRIKRTGILSSEFGTGIVEDAETFYSADFWRVKEETSMKEYSQKYIKEAEGWFLPLRKIDYKIAFIINTSNEHIKELLSYDAFRNNGEASDMSKSIISQGHLESRSGMKDRLAAILFGVPASALSGIIIGKRLIEVNPEKIEEIKTLFPDLYITTQEGELIYEPQKELPITQNPKQGVKKIAAEVLARDIQSSSSEIRSGIEELKNPENVIDPKKSLDD